MRCVNTLLLSIVILWLNGCDKQETYIEDIINNMVYVEGGDFEMGDFCLGKYNKQCAFSKKKGSIPVHTVTLDSFYIAKYKVTYKDYDFYTIQSNLPNLKISKIWLDSYPTVRNENFPATANWQLSQDYCHWLSEKTGLPFDLPTEAQWEYAARNRGQDIIYSTSNGHFSPGSTVPTSDQVKKYSGYYSGLYPVGKFPSTPLGLYDMTGNGQEWVRDWFSKNYYQQSTKKNPSGPTEGTEKVLRGMPASDSRIDDRTPTATTMFRTGRDPLLKTTSLELLNKYNWDHEKADAADKETDPYKIAERGFYPDVTFRCVINAQSLPEKYR